MDHIVCGGVQSRWNSTVRGWETVPGVFKGAGWGSFRGGGGEGTIQKTGARTQGNDRISNWKRGVGILGEHRSDDDIVTMTECA